MLKIPNSVKKLEDSAAQVLREALQRIPAIGELKIKPPAGANRRPEMLARFDIAGRHRVLLCEISADGQPRHVRTALLELRDRLPRFEGEATPVLIAPYLSPDAQALCRKQHVGFLDLQGNYQLAIGEVFIERIVANKPPAERRELKSIFKPKSAQILRTLLRDPRRVWRTVELAEAADVSLGHVSNIRTALLDREWARIEPQGFSLVAADALLDAWRESYESPRGEQKSFYTTLHGRLFEEAIRKTLGVANANGNALLASFSAAQWTAPYARVGSEFFYADEAGLEVLREGLKLSSASMGENVMVSVLKEPGVFLDRFEPVSGVLCTGLVQTYLDLARAGERGREAADHLRREKLAWSM